MWKSQAQTKRGPQDNIIQHFRNKPVTVYNVYDWTNAASDEEASAKTNDVVQDTVDNGKRHFIVGDHDGNPRLANVLKRH